MKKLLFLSTFLIFACSSSDDANNDYSNTSIVGNWQLTSILESGTPIHNSCDLESNMTVLQTNTGNFMQYYSDESTSEFCGESMTIDMTWSQEGSSSTYYITFAISDTTVSVVLEGETLTSIEGSEVRVFTKN